MENPQNAESGGSESAPKEAVVVSSDDWRRYARLAHSEGYLLAAEVMLGYAEEADRNGGMSLLSIRPPMAS